MAKKRVLILGGGFGGVYVAVHLGKLFTREELEEIEIVLVNKENYITFQPLLPEVISGSVELNHVIAPLRRMAPKSAALHARCRINRSSRAHGDTEPRRSSGGAHSFLRPSRDRDGHAA